MATVAYPDHAKTFQSSRGYIYSYAHFSPLDSHFSTIIFLHGFPSSSADWHSQISHVTSLGYGAIAIDLLGYGESSKPEEASEYGFQKMADDIVELISSAGLSTAHFVAHDFGCHILARLVTFHAELIISAVFIAVPFNMPGEHFDIEKVKEITLKLIGSEKFAYMRFLAGDESWKLIDRHAESMSCAMLTGSFYEPGALKAWLMEDKKVPFPAWAPSDWTLSDRRANILEDGYRGPTNWYRALLSNQGVDIEKSELSKGTADKTESLKFQTPIMFIESAPGKYSMPTPPLDQFFETVRTEQVTTKGHWIMLESPHEVNHLLVDFLRL